MTNMLGKGVLQKLATRAAAATHWHRGSAITGRHGLRLRVLSTEATASTTAKDHHTEVAPRPYTDIPGPWKGRIPILGAMPLFMPFVEKEAGGMRTEDFMRDLYENHGGKTHGIIRWGYEDFDGSNNSLVFLVFDEGYLQVQKKEGKYPSGILTGSWPIQHYNDRYLDGLQNPFMKDGEGWRQGRMDVNPYIFNKKNALSYLPTINEAANRAVEHFQAYATTGQLDRFCELAAFDMFVAAGLGLQMECVGGSKRGQQYAENIIGSLASMGHVSSQCPYSKIDSFKFKTWDKFVETWDQGRETIKELMKLAFDDKEGSGKGIMHGFLGDPTLKISEDEAIEMFMMLTFAAADTTSSLINNVLTNLSKHWDVQDKVRAELQRELGGSDYHADNVGKLPYFDQVLKESQRLTPPLAWVNVKSKIPADLIVHGYQIPRGSTMIFSHMGIANDEELAGPIPPPQEFNPDRFSPEAVAARKGTRAEFLDHPIACKPFGFGARMCVGSRIARLEFTSLICRILQDYQLKYDEAQNSSRNTIRLSKATTIDYPCPIIQVNKL